MPRRHSRDDRLLGAEFRKIQPKLRMFAKALDPVNRRRCEYASAMALAAPAEDAVEAKAVQAIEVQTRERMAGAVPARELKTPMMDEVSDTIDVNAFISRYSEPADADGGRLQTARISLRDLKGITADPDVAYVELGEPLKRPDALVTARKVKAPLKSMRNVGGRDSGGRGVLIGIIDVGGFDFAHSDFTYKDENGTIRTRWVRIWDQRDGGARPPPDGFSFGSEIRQAHMDAALSSPVRLPAWALEPQSQMQPGSHGTHVASIAAGNRGVCRNAMIAGVLIDLPDEITENRRKSFYDSTRVAQAVTYLCGLADELGVQVSINVSLGTNGGAHDASSGASRWIDHEIATPGRAVCVAAGNSGQEASTGPEDVGFVMGRIHTSGHIAARGLTSDIDWVVVGNGIADVSENELEIWYSGADRFAVSVKPPGMPAVGPIRPQHYVQNLQLPDGSMLSIYNELYHPTNGANYISIYLSPFLKQNPVVGVRPGLWRVRLYGEEVRDGRYHGWIERDDPRKLGVFGPREYWNFPSFFAERSNVDSASVSSLACGHRVVSVANLDFARNRINKSSSQGPTRDDRPKPDVAAPGTDIVAANGFAGEEDGEWIAMSGTSMASPFVAGVIGLMFEAEPKLTAAQINGIIQRTSNPLPGGTFEWADDAGYGVLDGEACVREARGMNKRTRVG